MGTAFFCGVSLAKMQASTSSHGRGDFTVAELAKSFGFRVEKCLAEILGEFCYVYLERFLTIPTRMLHF